MKTNLVLIQIMLIVVLFTFTNCKNDKFTNKTSGKVVSVPDTNDQTNNFYDNAETYELPLASLSVEGEIVNPGSIDFSALPIHSIIVKEAVLNDEGNKFIGAYRYDGYSLYDILNLIKIKKANEKEFEPIIDLYITIENEKGEKIIISWGEIYYPNHLHEIIIANQVTRIVPSKTKDLWPLPTESKLVVGSDLITERNISSPSKITVKSYKKSFKTVKGMKPLYSPKIDVFTDNKIVTTIEKISDTLTEQVYSAIFYGRGRGIHSTQPFIGAMLKDLVKPYASFTQQNIRTGTFLVVAKDGYRGVFTFSELLNRNDQAEVLLICHPELKDDGIFRLYPACDFFSDRAIKGISEVYFSNNEK